MCNFVNKKLFVCVEKCIQPRTVKIPEIQFVISYFKRCIYSKRTWKSSMLLSKNYILFFVKTFLANKILPCFHTVIQKDCTRRYKTLVWPIFLDFRRLVNDFPTENLTRVETFLLEHWVKLVRRWNRTSMLFIVCLKTRREGERPEFFTRPLFC